MLPKTETRWQDGKFVLSELLLDKNTLSSGVSYLYLATLNRVYNIYLLTRSLVE